MIERKRVSDLVSSIRDGRYHEQRARLKKTGLARVLYVIEGRVAEDTVIGLPLATVESVLTSMNGVHGLMVQHLPTIDTSITFIASLHRLIEGEMQQEGVPAVLPQTHDASQLPTGIPLPNLADVRTLAKQQLHEREKQTWICSSHTTLFEYCVCLCQYPHLSPSLLGSGESLSSFSSRLHKSANLHSSELFGTPLRQIRGVSAPLAMRILAHFPCARALVDAYERCASQEEEERMLHDMDKGSKQSDCTASGRTYHATRCASRSHCVASHLLPMPCVCVCALVAC